MKRSEQKVERLLLSTAIVCSQLSWLRTQANYKTMCRENPITHWRGPSALCTQNLQLSAPKPRLLHNSLLGDLRTKLGSLVLQGITRLGQSQELLVQIREL